jgi:hypothetical protein
LSRSPSGTRACEKRIARADRATSSWSRWCRSDAATGWCGRSGPNERG